VPVPPSRSIADLLDAAEEAFAQAAFCTGEFAEARDLLEQARERSTADDDRTSQATATERLALLVHYDNITERMAGRAVSAASVDIEEAFFRDALALRRDLADEPGAALPLFGLGLVEQVLRGDGATAIGYFREALALVEAWGDAIDLYTQSEVYRHMGFSFAIDDVRPAEAVQHLQRSLDLRVRLGDPRRIPSGLEALGEAEMAAGNPTRGLELLETALREARAAGLLPQRIASIQRTLDDASAATTPEA
jgi:tetratricopeptide (TPR) repeat protein